MGNRYGGIAGKVAVVTGSAGGMGRATAEALAAHGARVVVSDVDDAGGRETVARIAAAGGESVYARADVGVPDEVERLVASAVESYGRLDIQVNNAGIHIESDLLHESSQEVYDRIMAVNVTSVYAGMKFAVRQMLAQGGGGAIVNIASVNSFRPQPRQAIYTASKHAVIGMTKTAAIEYAELGIRVNAVAPGAVDTPLLQGALGTMPADVVAAATEQFSLVGRFGSSEEIAEAVLFLCSDAAGFVVGHTLAVDGGYLAR